MKKDQNDLPIEVDLIARKTPQLIVFLVTGLILSTCLASVQNEDTNDPTGTYILAAVDGEELPATVTHGNFEIEVHSGTFLISADGTCSSKVIFGPPSGAGFTREVKATYTREGSKLKMKWEGAGHTVGTVEGHSFTMINEGMVFAYKKQTGPTAAENQKVLDRFIGNWRSVSHSETDKKTSKVDLTYRRILGGKFVQEDGKGDDGTTAKLIYTYDVESKCYRLWSFRSWMPPSEATGEWDAETKTLTWTSVASEGQDIATHRFVDDNTFEWDAVRKDGNGNVIWRVKGKATRPKSQPVIPQYAQD